MNNHGFHRHFHHIGGVGTVELGTEHLGEIIQCFLGFPRDWTISSPQRGAGR